MHILHFYKSALPETIGGVEQVIDQIARSTTNLGVHNTVLALNNHPGNLPDRLNEYRLVKAQRDFEIFSTGFSWEAFGLFKRFAHQADLIHYHFPWPYADLIHMWVKPQKPTVLTYHSDIIRQNLLLKLYRPLRDQFLHSIDHIVATSPNYLNTSEILQYFSQKTSVIPIGLDEQSYAPPDSKQIEFYRNQFGERFFLFIGSFRYYKGLEFLIMAAKITPYPIVIAGTGPKEKRLKALAAKHQLRNIFFLGQIAEKNKSSLLAACYSAVFSSHVRSEAFGVFLLEGAMFGKPLISCEIGTGTTYININHLTGLVVPPSDPLALSNAMTWLWNHPEQAAEMGKNARAHFKKLFTAKQMAQSYHELYQSLFNR